MTKKFTLLSICAIVALAFSSCMTQKGGLIGSASAPTGINGGNVGGNSGSNSSSSNTQGLLGNLLSGLIGNNMPVSAKTIAGTWTYSSPDCRFQSENALAQAGGVAAATTVENKLDELFTKVGITPGACTFTFNADGTCAMTLGGRQINGTFTINSDTRDINIISNTGLLNLKGKVYYDLSNLTILFDAKKLLTTVQMVAAFTGKGSSSIATIANLLGNYDGMMIGMNMKK